MASAIHSLLFCLLLLAPHLGSSSYHMSYRHGGKHVVFRSPDVPSPTTSFCGCVPPGRPSPCAPIGSIVRLQCPPADAVVSQAQRSVADVLDRDAVRLRSLVGDSTAPAPAPTSSGLTIPDTGTPLAALPGVSEYHVVVGYGTPVQKLTVGFDTATVGTTLLQCKPCAAAAGSPCDEAFDPSQSSSLAQIPCDSMDCPLNACAGPSCSFSFSGKAGLRNGTVVTDTLTLSQSTAVERFRFACLEMHARTTDSASGILDLSADSHSLVSRVPSSPDTVAFSYCLPLATTAQGFLSVGARRPESSGVNVSYTPIGTGGVVQNQYPVRLVAISVAGRDIPVPPTAMDGYSLMELHTTFTYLPPDVYAVLRAEFGKEMTEYRSAPAEGDLDTCYDFTGLDEILVPIIGLKFDGGAAKLELDVEQMMYFKDRNVFSVGCLAFAVPQTFIPGVAAVIGTLAQTNTEVVYDVAGGKVGFVPDRCG